MMFSKITAYVRNLWPGSLPVEGRPATLVTCLAILLLGGLLLLLINRFVLKGIGRLIRKSPPLWDDILHRRGVIRHLLKLLPGFLVLGLTEAWLPPGGTASHLMRLASHIWLLVSGLLSLFALLDSIDECYSARPYARHMPLRGFIQGVKMVALSIVLILTVALLMGKSPALLVSGLGAMTAVLMLIFKDPILGLVAGVQLSANRMLAVGDWLEMPKYQADGDVIDITLTTVKVQNWDKTITTVPTYALISDSFKNWRGMQEAGGRRIKRSLYIDSRSVRFLTEDDLARLRKAQLLTHYIDRKLEEIERSNREQSIDPSSPVNGRRLTNVGTFRAYLQAYLRAHPGIHPEMLSMVRQLQPTPQGLPLEIYAFTRTTSWADYEGIQADIFDHVLAVVPEFGLRIFQLPSGDDLSGLLPKSPVE
jgi:miniconductance mechanosensitive channel